MLSLGREFLPYLLNYFKMAKKITQTIKEEIELEVVSPLFREKEIVNVEGIVSKHGFKKGVTYTVSGCTANELIKKGLVKPSK